MTAPTSLARGGVLVFPRADGVRLELRRELFSPGKIFNIGFGLAWIAIFVGMTRQSMPGALHSRLWWVALAPGVLMVAVAILSGIRRNVFDVDPSRVQFTSAGVFGARHHSWDASGIRDVRVDDFIHPRTRERRHALVLGLATEEVRLLQGRPVDHLEALAGELRRALRMPVGA